MLNFLKQHKYDTVIVVGSVDIEIDIFLQLSDRIVLVEPDQDKFNNNKEKYVNCEKMEHYNLILGAMDSHVTYCEYNAKRANHYKSPSGIMTLFPRLVRTGERKVEVISVTKFFESLNLVGSNNLLVINALGCEFELLSRLEKDEKLCVFKDYLVHSSYKELYSGSGACGNVIVLLNSNHYKLVIEDNSIDADIPCFVFELNSLSYEQHEQQLRLDALSERMLNMSENEAKLMSVVEEERLTFSKLLNEKDANLDALTEQLSEIKQQLELCNVANSNLLSEKEQMQRDYLQQIQVLNELVQNKNQHMAEMKLKNSDLLVQQRMNKILVAKLEQELKNSEKDMVLLDLEIKKLTGQLSLIKDFMFAERLD